MLEIDSKYDFKPYAVYDKGTVTYIPPVYVQRYSAVIKCLELKKWNGQFKKIVEFGCAEMKLLYFLKSIKSVEHIVQVDIDQEVLRNNLYKTTPLHIDYIDPRANPLRVDVYRGSIDAKHDCLLNTDVVICIEIIEHLYPDTVENMPNNIFGFMKPKLVLFSTPNSECNELFNINGKFRHDDHKFEWTRQQFQDWADNLCVRYSDYKVFYYGIGPGPEGTEHLGCCTQMAIFVRKDLVELDENCTTKENSKESIVYTIDESIKSMVITDEDVTNPLEYKLLKTIDYPVNRDDRTREQKILDEAKYCLQRFYNYDRGYFDYDNNVFRVPVDVLFRLLYKYTEDINEFRHVMISNGYVIENDIFVLPPQSDNEEEDEDEEEDEEAGAEYFISSTNEDEEDENWDI